MNNSFPPKRSLNPSWAEANTRVVNQCPYFILQSMTLTDLQAGQSQIELNVQEKHLQPFGIVHGGVFSSLIDACGWWASYTELEENLGLTTVEMKLNYLAPCRDGIMMIGRGRSLKMGKTVGLAEARIENQDGRLLAHGTVTTMVVPDLEISGQATLPAKFMSS